MRSPHSPLPPHSPIPPSVTFEEAGEDEEPADRAKKRANTWRRPGPQTLSPLFALPLPSPPPPPPNTPSPPQWAVTFEESGEDEEPADHEEDEELPLDAAQVLDAARQLQHAAPVRAGEAMYMSGQVRLCTCQGSTRT